MSPTRACAWCCEFGVPESGAQDADPRLRVVLTFQSLLVGGNPFATTSVYCLIAFLARRFGEHFALGGTRALVNGLVGLIQGQRNRVRCKAGVAQILVKDGAACGVLVESGERVHADAVVSHADSATTYKKRVAPEHRKRWTDARIERSRYSMSLFVGYFGTRRQYPDVAHHTIALGPRYQGLLTDIFERKHLAEDFSLCLHRPTATDPSLAPPGCDAFYALSPVPHLQSGTDWTQAAEPYRQRVMQCLSSTLLPGLAQEVISSRVLTPLDFQDRLSSFRGAAFGLEPVLTQSAWFRPHNASEELDRLYLVGAGTHPGAGLPGVLSSARVLDSVVPHGDTVRAGVAVAEAASARHPCTAALPEPAPAPALIRKTGKTRKARKTSRINKTWPPAANCWPTGHAPFWPHPICCRAQCATRPARSVRSATWPTTRWTARPAAARPSVLPAAGPSARPSARPSAPRPSAPRPSPPAPTLVWSNKQQQSQQQPPRQRWPRPGRRWDGFVTACAASIKASPKTMPPTVRWPRWCGASTSRPNCPRPCWRALNGMRPSAATKPWPICTPMPPGWPAPWAR